MTRYAVAADGTLTDTSGIGVTPAEIADTRLHVPHLAPHILTLTLPKGDRVNIIVGYSSHCWTRTFDPAAHAGQMQIMDGIRPRAFCPDRYVASSALGGLLANLHRNRLYLTPSDRNYGTYNNATTILANGTAYTAFFTLKPHKGRFDGIRHKLRLYVESAHQRGRVASITGQARSTLTRENGQPTDSNLAQPSSVILLRARTPICASVF